MKFTRLIIPPHRQFGLLDLNLTYPKGHERAGEPLDKVCFIGKNGTGKTTVLEMVKTRIELVNESKKPSTPSQPHLLCELAFNGKRYSHINSLLYKESRQNDRGMEAVHFRAWPLQDLWENSLEVRNEPSIGLLFNKEKYAYYYQNFLQADKLIKGHSQSLLIYSPSEAEHNKLLTTGRVPKAELISAINRFKKAPQSFEISPETIDTFWELVVYLDDKRKKDREAFEKQEENFDKTKRQLTEEFDQSYPSILDVLAEAWAPILETQGLMFDVENAKAPEHSLDNLEVYFRRKDQDSALAYSQMSSGTRHLLMRLGYFAAIYYRREADSSIALFDEVENSLYPDLLFSIVERYEQIASNTQFFFATHNPIVAAQFEPCERFIFDFDEDHLVTVRRGEAAEGDDPNDLLLRDFGLDYVYGEKGREMRKRFFELQIKIKETTDPETKAELTREYLRIGQNYRFTGHA